MQSATLISARAVHPNQLRPQGQHRPHLRHVPRIYCISEARNGRAIDKGFELRPALKAIGAGEHPLRIVKSEMGGIGVALELTYFSNSS